MNYVIYALAAVFVLFGCAMFFASYRNRHFGLFIMAMTYTTSGLLAAALPHWWPLVTGFVLVWLLRLLGLEPQVEVQEVETGEGGGAKEEAKK